MFTKQKKKEVTERQLAQFISDYDLSTKTLAAKIGVSNGTFSAKKIGSRHSKFTPPQVEILKKEIDAMCHEWNNLK